VDGGDYEVVGQGRLLMDVEQDDVRRLLVLDDIDDPPSE
jgi:hypothetical protein